MKKVPRLFSPVSVEKAQQTGVEEEDNVRLTLPQKANALAKALPPAYWQALVVVGLLYFARFDASFITLRAKTVRTSPAGSSISVDGMSH